jgi:hypothetical protein
MEAKSIGRYLRVSPFKARQVADLVRGKDANEAVAFQTSALPFSLSPFLSINSCLMVFIFWNWYSITLI